MSCIAENIDLIRGRIEAACGKSGREPSGVQIVGVTKHRSVEQAREALTAGLTILGENRVQEAREKIPQLPESIAWHLIGHLQTNKAKYAVRLFDLIHSLDSPHLAEALEKEADKQGKVVEVLVQVNVSGEVSKFGLPPENVESLLRAVGDMPHLRASGLMTMAPFSDDAESARPVFRELRRLRDDLQHSFTDLKELSMGMTQDYQVAVEEGATLVRIGTAIFTS